MHAEGMETIPIGGSKMTVSRKPPNGYCGAYGSAKVCISRSRRPAAVYQQLVGSG